MTLPAHVVAAGVLVWDSEGRLLMVKTHNRETLILPGGLVEDGESPDIAGQREVLEEVGIDVRIGPCSWYSTSPPRTGSRAAYSSCSTAGPWPNRFT